MPNQILSDAQLRAELRKCEFCEEKPCREACPAHCSPADFILAAKLGEPADYQRAAAEIMMANPFGGVCGLVCPETHCKAACVYKTFDRAVEIPSVQATLIAKAKALGVMPRPAAPAPNGKQVAVVGAGPAGLAAAAYLARLGYAVTVFDQESQPGGTCNWIPEHRLPRDVVQSDIEWLLSLGLIELKLGTKVSHVPALLSQGYQGVVVATGLMKPFVLGIPGEEQALAGLTYLKNPGAHPLPGKVAVIGGGATAVDCAVTAKLQGASAVELICLERWDEMPLTTAEREELQQHGIELLGRTRLTAIRGTGQNLGLELEKVTLAPGAKFSVPGLRKVEKTASQRWDFNHVIVAIGARSELAKVESAQIVWAGDAHTGPATVVQASASGKNAAQELHASLSGEPRPVIAKHTKSRTPLPGYSMLPVPLDCDFFGRPLRSPFLLSAAPPSDGYDQMRKAYEAGWAGGVMKTAFDGVPIHIPARYMHAFDEKTYGNCDNVSGHPLDRVCDEIRRLVAEFPDRLTLASTGGPVTGDDEHDRAGWQANTKKLEAAGVMGIEYSLSCPQGGDGTEGDIVSQNPKLTAKIIEWILEVGDPEIPKLFKLTGAVTSIAVILRAVKEVLDRFPTSKAGVTLANTFPSLTFRAGDKAEWEEGILVGMSGEGVAPISNLTLATVANLGVTVSGNGGPMDHKAAAHFLALGARTVQFCTVVMKQGYGVVDHLHAGLSHLLSRRGLGSVGELIGRALPHPVTGFMDLSPVKGISQVTPELCRHCGNCTRCPYLAITLDEDKIPHTDPARCIGCSICVQKCFSLALHMRERTPAEAEALRED
ncbi:MAG: FAD-dependent oxidoreductase [Myxococcota bacterium]|jgi:NADPH-dependent glutamate synthase beta subunit-like oxidoreductase/dihydroorotate dehydrogenase|nr:FAD-dependent oxidoreductase [Myxococcota bacterium]